jgi:hypothetical protein
MIGERVNIDLKAEQAASLDRPRMKYTILARMLFWGMDVLYGKKTTLPKARLLEILARIPYQAWENRQYTLMNRRYGDEREVARADAVIRYGRSAQDNEFWHLRVIQEKMKEDGITEGVFRERVIPWIACFKYRLFSRILAAINIRRAFLMNAEFEDHAEHVYMEFVREHPEWDRQKAAHPVVRQYGPFETWGDVFRSIGLDERDHMNESLHLCGLPERVVPYVSARA